MRCSQQDAGTVRAKVAGAFSARRRLQGAETRAGARRHAVLGMTDQLVHQRCTPAQYERLVEEAELLARALTATLVLLIGKNRVGSVQIRAGGRAARPRMLGAYQSVSGPCWGQ